MTCKDGRKKNVEFRTTFMEDGTVNVLNDITERRRAEIALQESEEKYRNIFENAVEGIYQSTLDGRLLSANRPLPVCTGPHPGGDDHDLQNLRHQLYINPRSGPFY
jgi:PAS domain-containing protein